MNVVIGDFGLARELKANELATSCKGTAFFMAPEMIYGKYDSKVDVWSFGTLFYELITGLIPFSANHLEELMKTVEKGDYWMPKDVNLSIEGLSFLNSCLKYKPEDR